MVNSLRGIVFTTVLYGWFYERTTEPFFEFMDVLWYSSLIFAYAVVFHLVVIISG